MKDTRPEIEALFLERMMSRTSSERVAMAGRMFQTGKALVEAGILEEYGELSPAELRRHLFLRLYGQDFPEDERERIAEALATRAS